ncbi:Unknown protein [Striga hermonthica]|uniref:Uncharacterized protein n=1 Tax=Striga hermonthica TaxID=68872 RepID=A0A9N7MU17_STRHE|nr:Unknown protein [Striga hermonthica]
MHFERAHSLKEGGLREAQLAEANERYEEVIKELNEILEKLASSEGNNEELKRQISEVEGQLASHMNTISELTQEHSRVSELHLVAEARISEAEAQLEEAIQKSSLKDLEDKDLYEKLKAFEAQVSVYEEQARKASALAKSRELEIEQVLLKSKELESGRNWRSEISGLQANLSAVSSEKEHVVEELNVARKEIEELTQKLASEGQKLVSKQLKEQKLHEDALKSKLEILNSDVAQKAELENHLKEIKEQLATAEARLKEEKELSSQKDLEREAALKHLAEVFDTKLNTKEKEMDLLENKLKDFEQKLKDVEQKWQLADAKFKEKDIRGAPSEQKDETIKSWEIDLSSSAPIKRKSKKKTESTSGQALSSATQAHTAEESSAMNFKFI